MSQALLRSAESIACASDFELQNLASDAVPYQDQQRNLLTADPEECMRLLGWNIPDLVMNADRVLASVYSC